jgi:hypothetical protein
VVPDHAGERRDDLDLAEAGPRIRHLVRDHAVLALVLREEEVGVAGDGRSEAREQLCVDRAGALDPAAVVDPALVEHGGTASDRPDALRQFVDRLAPSRLERASDRGEADPERGRRCAQSGECVVYGAHNDILVGNDRGRPP